MYGFAGMGADATTPTTPTNPVDQPPDQTPQISPHIAQVADSAFGFNSMVSVLLRAVGGFLAGRALAPNESKRNEYGAMGAAAATAGGVVGLGIMAAVTAGKR